MNRHVVTCSVREPQQYLIVLEEKQHEKVHDYFHLFWLHICKPNSSICFFASLTNTRYKQLGLVISPSCVDCGVLYY